MTNQKHTKEIEGIDLMVEVPTITEADFPNLEPVHDLWKSDQKHTKWLLPCPFCGGDPDVEYQSDSMVVFCTDADCGCRVWYGTLKIEECKWNMRDNAKLDTVAKQLGESAKLCSDLIAENAGLKNSRDELREALNKIIELENAEYTTTSEIDTDGNETIKFFRNDILETPTTPYIIAKAALARAKGDV